MERTVRNRAILGLAIAFLLAVGALVSCAPGLEGSEATRQSEKALAAPSAPSAELQASEPSSAVGRPQEAAQTASAPSADSSAPSPTASSSESSAASPAASSFPAYPTGWLIAPIGDVPSFEPVEIRYLPGFDIAAHRGGQAVPADEQQALDAKIAGMPSEGDAVVEYAGALTCIPADYLLVNMPDLLPQAVYDVVYSYASTSRCAGQTIPGVTDAKLPGYADGMQHDAYLSAPQYAVPCAYRTALKAQSVCERLAARELRLLVYDAYRPMTAQLFLSDSLEAAYYENPAIGDSLGAWSLTWYVANGPSGHNFGTDLDVSACDKVGNPIPMPSAFDAFDDSGHLTTYPMNPWDIGLHAYRPEVLANAACMALHEAFVAEGFSELASEWWHFSDDETQSVIASIAGSGGLDFTAYVAGAS